jgi:multidrug resistance efflux pump
MNSSAGSRRWAESPSSRELRRFSKRGCSGVKKGDLLYQLEQPPFQAQVDAAKANVDQLDAQHRNAQISLARAKDLLEKSAGPQSNYDSALAAERALAAQIDGAEAQLKRPRSISAIPKSALLSTARSAAPASPQSGVTHQGDTGDPC